MPAILALFVCFVAGLGWTANASAATAGILPPHNPARDCRSTDSSVMFTLTDINDCRALEGVGAVSLPSNWNSLTTPERIFVLANIERVNRGEVAITALTSGLDKLAQAGAANQTDPNFPSGSSIAGGSVWAGGSSVIASDDMWMYYDGLGGLDYNVDCSTKTRSYCWGHRDIILFGGRGGKLYAGAGYAAEGSYGSFTLEVLSGVSNPNPVFTWASELRYFATRPHVEARAIRRR